MTPPNINRFARFAEPGTTPLPLLMQPRLESWDAKTHPSQIKLQAYLDHLLETCREPLEACADTAIAVKLCIALPEGISLIEGGRDLDNYLFPVVRAIGVGRVGTAWAVKGRDRSTISVTQASASAIETTRWSFASARTTVSTAKIEWKQQVWDQVKSQVSATAPEGPLELQMSLRVSPNRNWAYLWKPAVDSLGCILGEGPRSFHPHDDRIVRIGFHRTRDADIGNDVEIGVWWRQALV